jgi:Zn-finger protein
VDILRRSWLHAVELTVDGGAIYHCTNTMYITKGELHVLVLSSCLFYPCHARGEAWLDRMYRQNLEEYTS